MIFGSSTSDTEDEANGEEKEETNVGGKRMKGSEIENVVNLLGLQTLSPLTNPASSLPLPEPFYNDGWPPVLLSREKGVEFQRLESRGLDDSTAKKIGDALASVSNNELPFAFNSPEWVRRHSANTGKVSNLVPGAFLGNKIRTATKARILFDILFLLIVSGGGTH